MSNITKKIIIGTANFTKKYGYLDRKLNLNKKKELFNILKKKKILIFDTALNYCCLNFLKKNKFFNKDIKIITKVPSINNINFKKVYDILVNKISKIKSKQFEAILLHDTIKKKKSEIINSVKFLKKIKKEKLAKKIGLSLYYFRDYLNYRKYFKPDIIQVPVNIFDQEFVDKKIVNLLKKDKIEIHARSIFLQGLLLESKMISLKKLQKITNLFELFCKKNNISKLDACMNYILKFRFLKKIVIGVNEPKQLKEILSFSRKKINFNFFKKISFNKKIIKPNNWN